MGKIFVRERRGAGKGKRKPRFTIVGVHGADLKVFEATVRKAEVEAIAAAVDAEIVYLPRGTGEKSGKGE
jgi:hypothetical protein